MTGVRWKKTTIGEQATLQRGIDITKAEQRTGHVPVISSGGISSYHDTAMVKGPGVILGRKGVVGSVYYIEQDYWPHDTSLWVKDFHGNHPRFVYYFFRSVAPQIARMDVGSANPTLNRNHVHPIEINWLPLPEQEAIAAVLGALDDKIELNRRVNETLEALARALFQTWFVDATQAGLPKGWEVRGLDEIANFLNGLTLQKFPPNGDDSLPVIKIAQLRAGHTEGADRAGTNLPSQYIIEDGDVLFSWSGSLEVEIWCGGRGALNQHLFKVTSAQFPKWFYYLWTRHHLADFQNTAANKATTMGHIQRHHLSEAKAFVPPPALMETMNKQFVPLVDKLIANRLESRTLAALRDALLPKLLSGELRVPAAKFVD